MNEPNLLKGVNCLKNKEYIIALQYFNESLRVAETDAAYYQRGVAYSYLNMDEDAILDFNRGINITAKKLEEAKANQTTPYKQISSYYLDVVIATKFIMNFFLEKGGHATAEEYCSEMLDYLPYIVKEHSDKEGIDVVDIFISRAIARHSQNKINEAIKDYAAAFKECDDEWAQQEILRKINRMNAKAQFENELTSYRHMKRIPLAMLP